MKRIVFICPYDVSRPGGVRTHIFDLARTLAAKGHEVCVVGSSSKPMPPQEIPLLTLGGTIKMPLWGTNIDITRLSGTEIRQLRQYFNRFKPDVIHFHTPWTPFISWQILRLAHRMRNQSRMPRVNKSDNSAARDAKDSPNDHVYESPPHQPRNTSSGPNNVSDRHETKFVATFHDSPPDSFWGKILGSFIMPAVAKYFLNAFDSVISVSRHQSQFISKWSKKPIHIIPNGIVLGVKPGEGVSTIVKTETNVLENFNSTETPKSQSTEVVSESAEPKNNPKNPKSIPYTQNIPPNILFLGRLEPRKGIMHMLEAYVKVLESIPHARLTIAGDGPDRKQAETFVKIHSLKNVQFLGMVMANDKSAAYRDASVYVSPALYGESFGIVLLEAMTYGIPITGFGNPGYLSVVGDLCPENFPSPGDTASLANRIIHILQHENYRETLVSRYASQLSKYDWNTLADDILDVYHTKS
jgi:phosphatidylinositol alpha-mannosyltransferase